MSSLVERATARTTAPGLPDRLGGRIGSIGLLVAVVVGVATAVRVLYNAPVEPTAVPSALVPATGTIAALGSAVALAAVALSSDRPAVRVGFLFAGVFGVLATVADAATVAAAVAIPGGAAVVFGRALGLPSTDVALRRGVLALAFTLAAGLSLAATAGIAGPSARAAGSIAFLAGVSLLAVRGEGDSIAFVAGGVAFAGVVVASAAAPYVTGSALLVGFAVVGTPHLLVATAAFGGITAAVAGIRDGDAWLAVGAVLLLLSGVPATPGAATVVCLGAALAVLHTAELLGTPDAPTTPTGVSDR